VRDSPRARREAFACLSYPSVLHDVCQGGIDVLTVIHELWLGMAYLGSGALRSPQVRNVPTPMAVSLTRRAALGSQ
jgi:hypothetical protein